MKQSAGIPLNLDERRCLENQSVKPILKLHQKDMLHVKDWLRKSFDKQIKYQFKKLGGMFCDGIILPRLALLFPKYNQYEAFLRGCDMQVQKISPAQVKGCIYVRLEDSANAFTKEFAQSVDGMILKLKAKLEEYLRNNEKSKEE